MVVDTLLPIDNTADVQLPLNAATAPPEWIVPTETSLLDAVAQASAPITFDWGFDDPDLESTIDGTTPFGQFSESEVTPGVWFMAPTLLGPDAGPTSGTVTAQLGAQLREFDPAVTSTTGDPQLGDINPNPPAADPATVAAGATVTVEATITPLAGPGTLVQGDLFVDDNVAADGSENELATIPYEYTVTSP